MKKYLYLIIILFLVSNTLFAQPWIENLKRQKPANTQTGTYNFYDIQQAFYQYWAGKDSTAKGKGWKPFKRWEWFWTPRVYPTGEFPNPNQTYTELKAFQKANEFNKKDKNKIQSLANWTSLGPTTSPGGYAGLGRINAVREDPNNSSVIYIGAASGGLWKSTNGGTSWTTTTDELGSIGVTDVIIDKNNSNIVYIATGDGDASDAYSVGVMKSTDGGNTWNTTGLNWTQSQLRTISRLLIDPTNSSILYAGGSFGIYKTTDAGASWSQVFSSMSVKDMEFKPGNSSVIYASGSYIYRSTNGGTNWAQLTNGLPSSAQRVALGVSPANSNYVYALMSNSSSGFMGLYRSTDGGDTWTTQATSPNLLGWESSGSDSGGQGWYDLCIAVDQSNINTIYTGGVNIWKSTNGGVNWAINAHWWGDGVPAVHADQHDLWFAPGTNRLYNGCDGGIYKTTNGGTNWNWLGSGLVITQFYRIGASQTNSNVWIAGAQDNGTKNYVNSTWQDVIGGDGMECIVDNSTTDYQYGELYYGRILRSSDGGNNFYDWVSPSSFSSEAGSWVTPYVQHPTNPQTLFIGYRNIYKTTDRGASWTKISSFSSTSTLNVLHVDPDNGTYIYASHGNDLMMSTDGGSNWSTKTLPSSLYLTYLAIKPTTPLVIYGSFSGYSSGNKVFYSTDGGSTWTNISYNLPNLPVNTIVYQKNTNRLYVGTDIGVFYLDPGQTSWVDFNSNLPNVVVNEIELQPAFSKMKIATYGRGIWETPIFSGEAVQLTAPSNSSTNVSITPTLTWNAVNLADKYELIIADNIQFNNPIVHKTNITSNSYIVQPAEVLQYSKTYYWKVRAIDDNAYGLWSNDGGTTYTFTTVPNPPGQVTLLTPADNSTNIAIDGNVSWQAEANSNTYKLQIATDVNFTNIVYNQTGIATTSFAYSSLAKNTKYYWRVLGTNAGGDGPWSEVWNFTTLPNPPGQVTLLTPANNSTNIAIDGNVSWQAEANSNTYKLQIATDVNFTNIVYNQTGIATTSFAYSSLAKNTKYYWRVLGTNAGGDGPWSAVWNFTTLPNPPGQVTLLTPANNSTNIAINGNVTWQAEANSSTYKLQIATDVNFTNIVYNQTGIATTSFAYSSLAKNTKYYWRVLGTNAGGDGPWSEVWNFTTLPNPPGQVTLLTPANNSTNIAIDGNVSWQAEANSSTYKLQIATDVNFTNIVYNQTGIATTSFAYSSLAKNTKYYWRVLGTNAGGDGPWSAVWNFTTLPNPPGQVTLLTPANNSINIAINGNVSWQAEANSNTYKLQIATDVNFTNIVYNQTGIATTSFAYSSLTNNTKYYWRVLGTNAGGDGPWSEVWNFTTLPNPPGQVTLLTPANNSINIAINGNVSWQAEANSNTYKLQIATDVNFTNIVYNQTGIATTSFAYSSLAKNTKYYWRVLGTNAGGDGPWSAVWNFTTLPNPPGQVTLLTPANNSANIAIDGNVSWQAEANSNTYKLQIATDVNFTNIVYNQTGIATTSFTYSSLTNSTKYYWRVLGTNAGGDGPWSAAWNFTTISQYPELVLNLTNKVTCKGTNVDLGTLDGMGNVITATGGSGNFTYNWNPSSLLSNATTGNPTYINPNMMQTFYLTVLDNITGITKTGSLNVAISNGPIISMPLFKVIKIGNSINLDNQITSITGGVPPYTKVWKDNFGNILANVVVTPPLGLNNYFLTVSDVGNCSSTKRLSVIVTNYKENIDENNIALSEQGGIAIIAFPNPVEEMLNYYIITADDLSLKIDLVNLEGKVLTEKIHNAQQTQRESINVDKLSAGTYFLKVTNGSETAYFKFVKK